MNFERAVQIILNHEGGYVWDKEDPGGETNLGISKRAYPHLDIKNITREDAIGIYLKEYWLPLKIDEMHESMRLIMFDAAVNQGLSRAVRMLQGSIGVKQDGIMGSVTLLALQETPPGLVFKNFATLRIRHYTSLLHWPKYGAGWSKRLLQVVLEGVDIL